MTYLFSSPLLLRLLLPVVSVGNGNVIKDNVDEDYAYLVGLRKANEVLSLSLSLFQLISCLFVLLFVFVV